MGREEEVRKIAHQIWAEEGQPEGRDRDHWQRAEAIWQERMEHLADDQFSRTDIVMEGSGPMRQAMEASREPARKPAPQRAPQRAGQSASRRSPRRAQRGR